MDVEAIIDIEKFQIEITESITDLTESMRTQTARAAYYGMLHAKAKKQSAKFALLIRSVDAALSNKIRKKAVDDGEKLTVDNIKALVVMEASMRGFLNQQIEADEIETICRVAYDAFRTRRDMLVSLGNLTRDQMRTGVKIQSAKEAANGYLTRRASREGENKPA